MSPDRNHTFDALLESVAQTILPDLQKHERDYELRRKAAGGTLPLCLHGVDIVAAMVAEVGMCIHCQLESTLREWALDIAQQRVDDTRRDLHTHLQGIVKSWHADILTPSELKQFGWLLGSLVGDDK